MKVSITFPVIHSVDDYHQFMDIVDTYKTHGLKVKYKEIDAPDNSGPYYSAVFYLPGQKVKA